MVDNVIHFVLARPEGAGPGTKGLSLFIVPKFHVDLETGELGERNGVYVTNVEKKMGLKVSTTCELTFGEKQPGRRHPARRRARRHRADVPGHRARPDDGRHQGHRHPVDRLPQRPGVRQAARPGRRPDPDAGQDRAARDDHPPPRRAPLADDPEGVRRGPARARALHRLPAGHRRPGQRLHRSESAREVAPPTWPAGSTTCCCRSSRASAPSGPGCCSAPSRCRPSAAPASSRTTRSSSTSATPRSTPSTRARRRSRARTSSSARSSATRARR
jgi:hypothetical protein